MSLLAISIPEVFSLAEIARAAGVSRSALADLVASGDLKTLDGRLVGPQEATRAVRAVWGLSTYAAGRDLFRPPASTRRSPGKALAASGALHAAVLGAILLLTSLGLSSGPRRETVSAIRLVFLPLPGPGGGGGGGGLRQPAPPAKAELKGAAAVRSPVPPPRPITTRKPDPVAIRRPPPPKPPEPVPHPVEPAPPAPAPTPQVAAPVATKEADPQDTAGVLIDTAAGSNGPGTGAGAGSGQGTGLGQGTGSGIGPGSGGGTGGGPYRPGSGITPPSILREVKPDYTDEARRRGVAGDVVLEIVVKKDGGVGDVRILQGLGAGLDQRAVDAVRAWRFSPARRFGTPVDVIVEVAVEFKLR
jgi:protein TonB